MGNDDQSNQLNLTVVALVALVAIVGLVALVMNAATVTTSLPKVSTGNQIVSAQESGGLDENAVGDVRKRLAKPDYG